MTIPGRVYWEANGIADLLADGFDETEVHRSTTGIGGVYSEITGPGTRVTLVAGTEAYSYLDTSAELTYYYKVRHLKTSTGLNSDFSEPFRHKTGWSIVKLNEKIPAYQKSYEDAKAEVASAYQEWQSKLLEEEYINRLRSVYDPKIYYDRLHNAFKSNEN